MVFIINTVELESAINSAINKAVENVAIIAVKKLKSFINMSFYEQYTPKVYNRTEKFLRSAAMDVVKGEASVYIDTIDMLYKEIAGEEVVKLASHGYHGNTNIKTDGNFWDEFTIWCKFNLITLLKEELRNQGLNI